MTKAAEKTQAFFIFFGYLAQILDCDSEVSVQSKTNFND
jgi:hypothetical protein